MSNPSDSSTLYVSRKPFGVKTRLRQGEVAPAGAVPVSRVHEETRHEATQRWGRRASLSPITKGC